MTLVDPGRSPDPVLRAVVRAIPAVRRGAAELALIGALYLLYRLGRMLARGQDVVAHHNAVQVHDLERVLRLPSEATLQALVPSDRWLHLANVYYVSAHFPSIIAFLVWGYVARPRADYQWARNLLIMVTGAALVIHVVYPLAPPRMFPQWGFLDTMAAFGPNAYGGASGDLANQFAAMPSLHVGWAALIAYVVARTGPRWLAGVAAVHVLVTTLVVVVTANHYWLDAGVALAILAVAALLLRPPPASEDMSRDGASAPPRPAAAPAP